MSRERRYLRVAATTMLLQIFASRSDAAKPMAVSNRPQDQAVASGTHPYSNEPIAFAASQPKIKLAGTLSLPEGLGPFPAVLLIAAAGPVNRDEDVAGHHVFVVLADDLLRRGIAVLRYDKRGVGGSTGDLEKASFDDLVADAKAAFDFLKARPQLDHRRLGIIGHSEGGSIAPAIAADDSAVSFIVAMADSGLDGRTRTLQMQTYMASESGAPAAVARVCEGGRLLCTRTRRWRRDAAFVSRGDCHQSRRTTHRNASLSVRFDGCRRTTSRCAGHLP